MCVFTREVAAKIMSAMDPDFMCWIANEMDMATCRAVLAQAEPEATALAFEAGDNRNARANVLLRVAPEVLPTCVPMMRADPAGEALTTMLPAEAAELVVALPMTERGRLLSCCPPASVVAG